MAYDIPQDSNAGEDTIHSQSMWLYMIDKIDNSNQDNFSLSDLNKLIKDAVNVDQDIVLTGNSNKTNLRQFNANDIDKLTTFY